MGNRLAKQADNVHYQYVSKKELSAIKRSFMDLCKRTPPYTEINLETFQTALSLPGDLATQVFSVMTRMVPMELRSAKSLAPGKQPTVTMKMFSSFLATIISSNTTMQQKMLLYVRLFDAPGSEDVLKQKQLEKCLYFTYIIAFMASDREKEQSKTTDESFFTALASTILAAHGTPSPTDAATLVVTVDGMIDFIEKSARKFIVPFRFLLYEQFLYDCVERDPSPPPATSTAAAEKYGSVPDGGEENEEVFLPVSSIPAALLCTIPRLNEPSVLLTPQILWILSGALQNVKGGESNNWSPLYRSSEDGISFNRFCHHAFHYNGPTITLFETPTSVFGVYSADAWRDSGSYFGDRSTLIFTLEPEFHVFPSTGSNKNYLYLNTRTRGMPHGCGIGGDPQCKDFRVWVSEDFDVVKVSPESTTFEAGGLLGKSDAREGQLRCVETWGLGGVDEIKKQEAQRKRRLNEIQKQRRVDRKAFAGSWQDNPDKFLLDMAGVTQGYSDGCYNDKEPPSHM